MFFDHLPGPLNRSCIKAIIVSKIEKIFFGQILTFCFIQATIQCYLVGGEMFI
jgi:hypothetical protein